MSQDIEMNLIPRDDIENDPDNMTDNKIIRSVLKKSRRQLENEEINRKVASRLVKVSIVCFTFMVIEFVGGWVAGSLAIMSDAAHLLSDLAGFIISVASLYIANRPANSELTYGYGRYEVIGALTSILIIWVLTVWLVSEAIKRFFHPGEIMGIVMLTISICGLVFNLILGKILSSEELPNAFERESPSSPQEKENSNTSNKETEIVIDTREKNNVVEMTVEEKEKENPVLRAAILHILGDILQSIGVLTAAIIIYIFQDATPKIVYVDPCCTLIFAIIVLCTTIPVSRDCIHVLMEATPKNIDLRALVTDLSDIKNVVNVHDVHVWALSIGKIAISIHILSNTPQKTLEEATSICKNYGIFHETIQVEDNTQRRRTSFMVCTHVIDNAIH